MKKINIFNRNINSPSYRRTPVSRGFNRGGGIPLFSGMTAVIFALFIATPSFATDPDPASFDARQIVASKAYVDTKQDIIETGLVEFTDETMLPAITTYDLTSGLVANKIGILDQETIVSDEGILNMYDSYNGGYGAEMDNYVPTVRAVAEGLTVKQDRLPSAWTNITNPGAMASMGGETIDLKTTPGVVGRRYITAGGAQPLTQKAGADNVILYINGTKTLAQYQTSNFDATIGQNYIKGALVSLELLKDVYGELDAKITATANALPTGTTGTVVTYNGTNATTGVQEFGERAIYDPANAYNAQNDATKLATMESVKYVCAGYEPAAAGQPAHDGTHPGDEDYCWLWTLPN